MRLRNIPGANEAVAASPYCIQNAAEHRGQWHAFFENDHPIHICLLYTSDAADD